MTILNPSDEIVVLPAVVGVATYKLLLLMFPRSTVSKRNQALVVGCAHLPTTSLLI